MKQEHEANLFSGITRSQSNKLILLTDLIVFSLIAYFISTIIYNVSVTTYLSQLGPTLLVVSVSLYLLSAFEVSIDVPLSSLLSRCMISVLLALSILLIIIYFLGPGSIKNIYGRGILLLCMSGFLSYLLVTRYFLFRDLRNKTPFLVWNFIGSQDHFNKLESEGNKQNRFQFLRKTEEWLTNERQFRAGVGVILDQDLYENRNLIGQLVKQKFQGARITSVDQFYEDYLGKVPISHIQEHWFINNSGFNYINDSIRQRVKRTIDLLLTIVTLPVTLLLGVISALLVFLTDSQNPVFIQERVGWHGRLFKIYKLRTMSREKDKGDSNWTDYDDPRITPLGGFLRRYRLDELPQLVNVLKGDMSIIGPRPEQQKLTHLLETEIPYYDIRHSVKPGITGWAQVKFRYGSSIKDSHTKLEYDLYYIKNYSLVLDLTILIKTFYTIFSGSGR